MSRAPGDASPVHEECVRAAEATAALLETLGHTVEVSHPGRLRRPGTLADLRPDLERERGRRSSTRGARRSGGR